VVGHGLVDRLDRREVALGDELAQQLGVVDDLVVAAELRVLVLDGVEAVRAGRHDLDAVLALRADGVEDLDVLLPEHLEDELVAEPAGRVTGAGLHRPQYGELDAGRVERSANARLTFFERSSRPPAQPTQNRYSTSSGMLPSTTLTSKGRPSIQSVRELLFMPHGFALVLEVAQHHAGLARERGLDEHLVAAHVDDVVDVLDVDRALLDAGAAGGAAPEHVGVDDAAVGLGADQRADGLLGRAAEDPLVAGLGHVVVGVGARVVEVRHVVLWRGLAPEDVGRLGEQVVAQVHDDELRAQRLAGVPRRALALAPAALGAAGHVEVGVPAEVLDPAGAEGVGLRVGLLEVEGHALAHHRLQRAEATPSGLRLVLTFSGATKMCMCLL